MSNFMVCVYCITYNHGKYIRKTLQGFADQKTSFKFRVIVHDDASTDNTAEIMREFEERYPELFCMMYEEENQYSKGVEFLRTMIYPSIHEKYTAICEGDDYWCDEHKLQKQYDYMEAHPGCSLCVHDSMKIDCEGNPIKRVNGYQENRDYSTNEVIAAGGGVLFHTSSFFAVSETLKSKPEQISIDGIGDYPMAIHLSMSGGVHYTGEVMSCYRIGDPNSWSVRESGSEAKRIKRNHISFDAMNKMDAYTNHKYKKGFDIERGCLLAFLYRNEYGVIKLLAHPAHLRMVVLWVVYKVRQKLFGKGTKAV